MLKLTYRSVVAINGLFVSGILRRLSKREKEREGLLIKQNLLGIKAIQSIFEKNS